MKKEKSKIGHIIQTSKEFFGGRWQHVAFVEKNGKVSVKSLDQAIKKLK